MDRVLAALRAAWKDFANVFGRTPGTVAPRLRKGLAVLVGMIRGGDVASPAGPLRMQIEVTDKCNFDCIMCNRLTRPNVKFSLANDINAETFTHLLDTVNPFYVTLNGLGEPALNKSIDKILIECRQRGINTQLPSNMSIKKVMLEKIAPNPPGILTFSMHGATKPTFEAISVNSVFEECIELFDAFLAAVDRKDVEIRILCALQLRNLREYSLFYDYLSRWKLLDNFVLVPVFDFEAGSGEERRVIPSETEVVDAVNAIDHDLATCADSAKMRFLQRWRAAILEIRASKQIIETGPCLVPWFSTYITAKGKVLPCCYLSDEDHVLGNINDEDFSTIWNGNKYQEFRRKLRENRGGLTGCRVCPRNDADRIRKYNPLSMIATQWNLNGTATTEQLLPPKLGGIVPLTIKGQPRELATHLTIDRE